MSRFEARPLAPATANDNSEWIVVDNTPGGDRNGTPAIISHHLGRHAAEKEAAILDRRSH